MLKQQMSRHL